MAVGSSFADPVDDHRVIPPVIVAACLKTLRQLVLLDVEEFHAEGDLRGGEGDWFGQWKSGIIVVIITVYIRGLEGQWGRAASSSGDRVSC